MDGDVPSSAVRILDGTRATLFANLTHRTLSGLAQPRETSLYLPGACTLMASACVYVI